MGRWSGGLVGLAMAALAAPAPVVAQEGGPAACYDVSVDARIVGQTEAGLIEPCDGCLAWHSRFVVEFDVLAVRRGAVRTGALKAQSVQHAYIREDRVWRVWLRRNSEGTYNLVGLGGGRDLKRCPAGAAPAPPMFRKAG